jgi:uncharacterized membrane protein YfcA
MFMNGTRKRAYYDGAVRPFILLAAGGFLSGLCNGLLGAGGGIIAVLFLSGMVGSDSESRRSVYANALCLMLPLSFMTLWRYSGIGGVTLPKINWEFVLGAAAGGLLGGCLLGRIRGRSVDIIFAILTVLSGILMLAR